VSQTASPAATAAQAPAQPPGAAVSWQARRRRPGLLALAAACVAACAVGNYWYWSENGQRAPVLVVAHEVPAGNVIREGDLVQGSVALDPALKAIGASQRGSVVGKRAAVELLPGALLSPGQITTRTLVKPGEQLVGIGLKAGQLPDSTLRRNDQVQVVFTAKDGAAVGDRAAAGRREKPETVDARVMRVGAIEENTGSRVIDVAVPQAEGPRLAEQAASGDVALAVNGAGS
ncbi:SAF domain-containing protein, partial [Streptomyces formicae]